MRDTDLFQLALGLSSPWKVMRAEFSVEDGRLDLHVDFPAGSRFACAECGRAGCGVHDTKEETWRHLDFFQHRAFLHARTPRVICPTCGVHKVAVPWARAGSGFTLLFEAFVLALAKAMPIANIAKLMGEHDTRLWRILDHYVWEAVEKQDLSEVRQIAADETSARRGHDYISLFVDMARRKVVYVADGKDAGTVKEFADFLVSHGGDREAISDASIDMGAAFEAGIKENFANAKITYRQVPCHQTRQRGGGSGAPRGGAEQLSDQGPALHLPQERREPDGGGAGGVVSVGGAEPGHDPGDADTHEPAAIVHDGRFLGAALSRSLERLGSGLRSGADEKARQDDHGQGARHPAIHRHRPIQRRAGGDQWQRPGRQTQSQRLSDQAKPQNHRLPHRWRCAG
ncbi:MAG: transposase [Betaproteobacteria bacterium]|nr:transposase [Betaproteobacteria bacterium]